MFEWIAENLLFSGVVVSLFVGAIIGFINQKCPIKYRWRIYKYTPSVLDAVLEELKNGVDIPYEKKVVKVLEKLKQEMQDEFAEMSEKDGRKVNVVLVNKAKKIANKIEKVGK